MGWEEVKEFRKQKRSDGPRHKPGWPFGGVTEMLGDRMLQAFHLPEVTLPGKMQVKGFECLFFAFCFVWFCFAF